MAWLSGFAYRKKITIDNTYVDSDLTDFPVLVKFSSDSDIGAAAQADGDDIRFTSSDGTTLLKYEREAFSVSGSASGTFWVKVPTVSGSADTEIYLYYGDSGAGDGADATNVWDSSFQAVYHLSESGNGTSNEFKDSTSNARHLTGGGASSTPTQAAFHIRNGQDFDGSNDLIQGTFSTSISSGTWTVEGWVNFDSFAAGKENPRIIDLRDGTNGLQIIRDSGSGKFVTKHGEYQSGTNGTEWNTPSTGTKYYVAAVFDTGANTTTFYSNGVSQSGSANSNIGNGSASSKLYLGVRSDSVGTSWLDGKLDEVRVSNAARSAAWIKFVYYSQTEADNEISFGAAEAAPATAPQQPWVRLLLLQDDNYTPPAITLVRVIRGLAGTGIFWGQGNNEGDWSPATPIDGNNPQGFGKSIGREYT